MKYLYNIIAFYGDSLVSISDNLQIKKMFQLHVLPSHFQYDIVTLPYINMYIAFKNRKHKLLLVVQNTPYKTLLLLQKWIEPIIATSKYEHA
jgi:hypothetical protein